MPIKFTDHRICEKCKEGFTWYYFELRRQNINSPEFEVEVLPREKGVVHQFEYYDEKNYSVKVNCPHCDYDNHFLFSV